MPRLPLLYKYHEFYNTLYYISSFANPVLTYRCYAKWLNVEPSNTNKYITGTLNRGKGRNRGLGKGGKEERGRGREGKGMEGKERRGEDGGIGRDSVKGVSKG